VPCSLMVVSLVLAAWRPSMTTLCSDSGSRSVSVLTQR
jgi:hypothetical protein